MRETRESREVSRLSECSRPFVAVAWKLQNPPRRHTCGNFSDAIPTTWGLDCIGVAPLPHLHICSRQFHPERFRDSIDLRDGLDNVAAFQCMPQNRKMRSATSPLLLMGKSCPASTTSTCSCSFPKTSVTSAVTSSTTMTGSFAPRIISAFP